MSITPGTRIGVYEITAQIGEGGMGQVYRATDSKLKRQVAIKILPPALAADHDRLARFQREAEVLASLNHPNIAAIYGLEESAGTTALVMELVEGDDLSQRLARGAIPIDEALPIAKQIAEALEAAHERGIIHRDLKPANIKVRADGTVKVLDFGLAKAMEPGAGSAPSLSMSPTLTTPAMTQAGMMLGTAAYMSPEQARGGAVDKHADLWALGVVLYEMLTGARLFDGATITDTLAAVLRAEPDWKRLPADTPVPIRRLLRRCLEKDRKRRFESAADARLEIEDALSRTGEIPDRPPTSDPRPRSAGTRLRLSLGAAAILLVAAGFVAGRVNGTAPVSPQAPSDLRQFRLTAADGIDFDGQNAFSVSPDGRFVAVTNVSPLGGRQLGILSLADGSFRLLPGPSPGSPTWSPDGQWIAGPFGSGSLVSVEGNQRRTLGGATPGFVLTTGSDLTWTPKEEILATTRDGGLLLIPTEAGTVKEIIPASSGPWRHPFMLPDGQRYLISRGDQADAEIVLGRLDGSAPLKVLGRGYRPKLASPDYVLATQSGRLVAWRFDPISEVLDGEGATIADGLLLRQTNVADARFSVSTTGTLVYQTAKQSVATQLSWFDRAGGEGTTLKTEWHCRNPELSPDGLRLAVECNEPTVGNRDIWVYDLARGTGSRLTHDRADDSDPLWSADGAALAFTSNRRGVPDVFRKKGGGSEPEELLLDAPPDLVSTMSWSPDRKTVLLFDSRGGQDITAFDVGEPTNLVNVVTTPFSDIEPQFSPDGRFFSYSSNESGRYQIYVEPWPKTGERWQVSTGGGNDARWRRDGREIFYLTSDRVLMAVPVSTGGSFRAGTPEPLFRTRVSGPIGTGHRFPYAVSPDGQRFLMYVDVPGAPPASLTVVLNWPALLKH